MKAFKVSCYSKCGSYFASYLKSVTVLAQTLPEDRWSIEEICDAAVGVIDYDSSSDY